MRPATLNRLVIHVGGYDPVTPEAAHGRFRRELGRFRSTWSVDSEAGPPAFGEDVVTWTVRTAGPNWAVRTEMHLLRWDDVMARAGREPGWRRLPAGLLAFADFTLGGALWGYLRRAWRYALFFLYPFVLLAVLAAAAAAIGAGLAQALGSALLGAAAGALVLVALVRLAGHRLMLDHLLDDWIFARRCVRAPDPVLAARVERVAGEAVAAARDGGFDEIVVIGHSLGAVLAVDLVDRALARDPAFGRGDVRVAMVTVGSSIPKIGLHRAATRFRAALGRVAASGLFWVEYQALTDAMNFYKTDPVRDLGAGPRGPLVRIVRISRMLDPAYYRRIKRNFFRVHNQFVSANDCRAPYDYFMLLCGPVPVEEQARARSGAETGIGPVGSLLGQEPAPPPSSDTSAP